MNGKEAPLVPTTEGETSQRSIAVLEQNDQNGTANTNNVVACVQNGENNKSLFSLPEGKVRKLNWMVMLPWKVLFYCTIPNCSKVFLATEISINITICM